jgi:hypothetical protein
MRPFRPVGGRRTLQQEIAVSDNAKPAATQAPALPGKVAVVVIHGMGEQKPMETLRGFVDTLWKSDPSLFAGLNPTSDHKLSDTWSKPDNLSGSAEVRRITTARARDPLRPGKAGVRADFFELHWADLTADSTWGDFSDWFKTLLWRNPFDCAVPQRLLPLWGMLWALSLAIVFSTAIAGAPKLSELLGMDMTKTWLGPILSWWGWSVVAALSLLLGGFVKAFLTAYFGDVARYVSAAPRNIKVRREARERGLKLLAQITASGDYRRIIVVGHSLGSILAHDLVSLAWSAAARRIDIAKGSELHAAVQACETAADALLAATAQTGFDTEEFAHGDRGCRCRLKEELPSLDHRDRLKAYRVAQRKLFQALMQWRAPAAEDAAASAPAWLISDLVTLGSPLTHAEILMASSRCELIAMTRSREILRSPPLLEQDKEGQFTFLHETARGSGKWQLHHAAALAAVRWTNVHDAAEPWSFLSGDIISGPLARDFGPGVVDMRVRISRTTGMFKRLFTHTLYWALPHSAAMTPVPDAIQVLRDVVNVLDDDAVEQRMLERARRGGA